MSDNIIRFDKNHKKKQYYKPIQNKSPKGPKPVLLIVLVVLIGGSFLLAVRQVRKDALSGVPIYTGNPYSKVIVTGKVVNYESNDSPPVKDDIWVMYQNLNSHDKWVYDMFLDLVENRDKAGYNSSVVISDSKLKNIGQEYFWNIYYAMCEDHPEYFFLKSDDIKVNCSSISEAGYTTFVFDLDNIPSSEELRVKTFEKAAKNFMLDIDLSASDSEIELQIHDKLIELVSYDYDLYEQLCNGGIVYDLGFTAYGALVQDSSGDKNKAVCEGYSMAYEYLLHMSGIPCATVSGTANQIDAINDDQGGHAWNVVRIDGQWYEVDTTWDDFESSRFEDKYQLVYEAYEDNEQLKNNVCHYYYNRTTAEMENMVATDSTVLNVPGYMPFNLRSDSSHVRYSNIHNDSDRIKVFMNSLVHVAE